jgi:KDO2-lipid IV(A) lauroyltransferase
MLRMSTAPSSLASRFRSTARGALDGALYLAIRSVLAGVGSIPLETATAMARGLARTYARLPSSRKRLRRAEGNLKVAFPDWPDDKIREHAERSYEHLFELGVELIQGPRLLTDDAWHLHMDLGEVEPIVRALLEARPVLLITGHCGNWELLGYTVAFLGFPMHAIYRPLDLAPLDRWVRGMRERRGLTLLDKFGVLRRLPPLVGAGVPIGFVADQNGGDRGVFVPFFNRLASTYKSIGLMALQFKTPIVCSIARRLPFEQRRPGLLGYRVEVSDMFGPEDWSKHPDPLFYLTARYRRAIETMVRAAPDQYLWMHRIWRSRPLHERLQKPFPKALEEKIRLLPWITDADVEAIKEHSRADARALAETGQDRLS